MTPRLLIAEDDADMGRMLARLAEQAGFAVTLVADGAAARAHLAETDAVATDLCMPGGDGMGLLERIRAARPDLPVMMITGYATAESAIQAFRGGVRDIITKPFDAGDLRARLANLAAELGHHERMAADDARPEGLETPGLAPVRELLEKAAETEIPVLLEGETGTGKGVAAQWLHQRSARAQGPFEAVNCAGIADSLVTSELFGHEKGAFTGAGEGRRGLLEAAAGGTLMLDEINSAAAEVQTGLLDFLQHRRVRRVGGSRAVEVDTRIVAATNRPLSDVVADGAFRADLYYRLNVFPVTIPPLRQRREDILPLAEGFLRAAGQELGRAFIGFTPDAMERLQAHAWPGNVRELENAVRRAAVLTREGAVAVGALPETVGAGAPRSAAPALPAEDATLAEVEAFWIRQTLERCGGNKSEAARRLDIDPSTLHRKLRSLGDDPVPT
ncbi:DNA-binding transcriptional response regulator, NtrC family, contains REC, AAA-type ATPase, and a Fis-type DNA-binding domains [Thiohalospira halophila DSM 15071]|uniref:DNA-binding transcriptional response regulator, NtrC family, contains REC, AAA-type ATPase, and a Fis-type DNA-binding domains n=1 Tax=Thiohalospira halophila DSM 15071 TaxID=1123397 RepID=A0A1I1TI12_9GAMM|nr:sigma-54 dependent transcriptional regulator [Thiohalospira halophila]SFD58246.1 DNA-binding transcriptional response regulator, NtrC family, contains REC, AAA-type ATPase, and a Fis-type DNA-binding domains [Thiohalospira halophila DSM 15071]